MLTYIVVADAARARVFSRHGPGDLREIRTLVDLRNRRHPGDLRTGGEGAVRQSTGAGNRRTDDPIGAMEGEASSFAGKVAQHMRRFRMEHEADAFIVAAEPQFLGLLREQLDNTTRDMIVRSVSKDYSKASADDIARHFQA